MIQVNGNRITSFYIAHSESAPDALFFFPFSEEGCTNGTRHWREAFGCPVSGLMLQCHKASGRFSVFIMLQRIAADGIDNRVILLLIRCSADDPVGSVCIFIVDSVLSRAAPCAGQAAELCLHAALR